MRVSLRERLRQRYGFRCGYCGISETDAGAQLTIDHFQPAARGGSNALSNLVYCCHACNEFKGEWWNPEGERRILHPLNDVVNEYIQLESDDALRGLTVTGIFHIERLRLNRAELLAHRRSQRNQDRIRHDIASMTNRLTDLEDQVRQLQEVVERLRTSDSD